MAIIWRLLSKEAYSAQLQVEMAKLAGTVLPFVSAGVS